MAAYFVVNDTTLFSGPELHHSMGRDRVTRLDGPLPFHGYVVWLTSEQGGRAPQPRHRGMIPLRQHRTL